MEEAREQVERWLDSLFRGSHVVSQLDVLSLAEVFDLPADAMDIVRGLPPGRYARPRLCDQLNSAIVGRGLSRTLGTYE